MGGHQNKQIVEYLHLDELEDLPSRVTYRVGKEVLDLPPETDVTYYCELSREARRVYNDVEEDFVAEVGAGVMTVANAISYPPSLRALSRTAGRWSRHSRMPGSTSSSRRTGIPDPEAEEKAAREWAERFQGKSFEIDLNARVPQEMLDGWCANDRRFRETWECQRQEQPAASIE